MEEQVDEMVKHERFNRLKMLVESQVSENNEKYVGTSQRVIVEGKSKTNPNMLTGRTENNKVVIFAGDESLIYKTVDVQIVCDRMWYLEGKI